MCELWDECGEVVFVQLTFHETPMAGRFDIPNRSCRVPHQQLGHCPTTSDPPAYRDSDAYPKST